MYIYIYLNISILKFVNNLHSECYRIYISNSHNLFTSYLYAFIVVSLWLPHLDVSI